MAFEQARRWRQKNPDRARELSRAAYWRSPEHARKIARASYQRLKLAVFKMLGERCVSCGNDDIRVLQINHREGGGRKDLIGSGKAMKFYRKLRNKEVPLDLFDLRCANCNVIYEYEAGRRELTE